CGSKRTKAVSATRKAAVIMVGAPRAREKPPGGTDGSGRAKPVYTPLQSSTFEVRSSKCEVRSGGRYATCHVHQIDSRNDVCSGDPLRRIRLRAATRAGARRRTTGRARRRGGSRGRRWPGRGARVGGAGIPQGGMGAAAGTDGPGP